MYQGVGNHGNKDDDDGLEQSVPCAHHLAFGFLIMIFLENVTGTLAYSSK